MAEAEVVRFSPTTVLVYGQTGVGKTVAIGQLAKAVFRASGGKIVDGKAVGGKITRLYASDNGGLDTIQPEIDLGIIEVIDVKVLPHPFLWALKAAAGMVPKVTGIDEKTGNAKGEWVKVDNSRVGVFAFDSLTSIAERMFSDLSAKAALGINIGGEGAYNFNDGAAGAGNWGTITVGSSNRMHYNVVHQRVSLLCDHFSQLAMNSQTLVVATCAEDRGENEVSRATIIGPKTVGKALTAELPRLFGLTFRFTIEPMAANKEPTHKCYLTTHPDKSAGNATALANRRLPMISPGHASMNDIPAFLEPSDLVKAIQVSQTMMQKVKEQLMKEMA